MPLAAQRFVCQSFVRSRRSAASHESPIQVGAQLHKQCDKHYRLFRECDNGPRGQDGVSPLTKSKKSCIWPALLRPVVSLNWRILLGQTEKNQNDQEMAKVLLGLSTRFVWPIQFF